MRASTMADWVLVCFCKAPEEAFHMQSGLATVLAEWSCNHKRSNQKTLLRALARRGDINQCTAAASNQSLK